LKKLAVAGRDRVARHTHRLGQHHHLGTTSTAPSSGDDRRRDQAGPHLRRLCGSGPNCGRLSKRPASTPRRHAQRRSAEAVREPGRRSGVSIATGLASPSPAATR
jgi:hypothetical protein